MSEQNDTPTEAPPATAPAPAPAPAPVTTPPPPATPDQSVPYARFAEVNTKAKEAAAEAERIRAEAEAARAEAAEAKAEAARWRTRHERDTAYATMSDRPGLQKPEVRRFVESEYEAYKSEATEAKPFAAWLIEDAPGNAILAPHLQAATPPAPAADAPKTPPPNPNANATPDAGAAARKPMTAAEIRELKAAGKWTKEHAAAEFDDLVRSGVISSSSRNPFR